MEPHFPSQNASTRRISNMEFQLQRPLNCFFHALCFAIATTLFRFHHVSSSPEPLQPCRNSFSCGDIAGIGYPFREDKDPDYCGYPGLSLSCDRVRNDQVTRIEIMSLKYRVLDIHPETRTMRVAREDVIESACPTDLVNTTLDPSSFDYATSSFNLTFLYGCPETVFPGLNQFSSCEANEYREVFVVPGSVGPGQCEDSVVYPVAQTGGAGPVNYTGLDLILRQGFEIRWLVDSSICGECSGSNGSCGYSLTTQQTSCYCPNPPYVRTAACAVSSTRGTKKRLIVGLSAGAAALVMISILIYCLFKRYLCCEEIIAWRSDEGRNQLEFQKKKKGSNQIVEEFMRDYGSIAPRLYTYAEIRKMTNSFAVGLGHGGYGCVYRGSLSDGREVAVKVLNDSKGDGEDFMNEVAAISRTSHVNVVALLGFCCNRRKRALIYEFMPNGSLDKFISWKESMHLEWKLLYQIALGIARGLEYLHRGCNTRIVHLDIKPQNILLDVDFCPKISDFGLAKLYKNKESVLSTVGARGTVGYIAPEMVFPSLGGVSHKSDVYSYGMMVLEMAGLTRKPETDSQQTSESYFPNWIHERVELGKEFPLKGVANEEEKESAMKMIYVGLWCIQPNPKERPSTSKVVEMLEGSFQSLRVPPKPYYLPSHDAAINFDQKSWTTSSIS